MRNTGKEPCDPDGRNAREPVSKNLCAVSGMERNGVTALMQSVLKLDHDSLLGSEPLDILLHPSAVRGEAGLKAVNALFRTYFACGGIALQGNVVGGKPYGGTKEPYKYRTCRCACVAGTLILSICQLCIRMNSSSRHGQCEFCNDGRYNYRKEGGEQGTVLCPMKI